MYVCMYIYIYIYIYIYTLLTIDIVIVQGLSRVFNGVQGFVHLLDVPRVVIAPLRLEFWHV